MFDSSKLKALTNAKSYVTHLLEFDLHKVENIMGKGENAGYQHFLLFPQCFQKLSFSGLLKVYVVELKLQYMYSGFYRWL